VVQVNRELYMPDGVDVARIIAHARERARAGEIVVLHDHAKDAECQDNCTLMYLVVTAELWQGELERSEYFRAHQH